MKVKLNSTNLEKGTLATYQCDDGYETFGDSKTICAQNGNWEGDVPFCGKS